MSRFECECGNVIPDTTDNLPYKAYFLPDEDTDHALDDIKESVARLVEAWVRGDQAQYQRWRLWTQGDPTSREVLYNHIGHPTHAFGRRMYECDQCGRIWMAAVPGENKLVSYLPESTRRGILRHQGADPQA